MQFKDYYAALGLNRDATPDEIKRAYRKLARKYHRVGLVRIAVEVAGLAVTVGSGPATHLRWLNRLPGVSPSRGGPSRHHHEGTPCSPAPGRQTGCLPHCVSQRDAD